MGTEIVQLYINDLVSSLSTPVKQLKVWERVHLGSRETRRVTLSLPCKELWMINSELSRVVEPGDFEIMVGPNSTDLQSERITISACGKSNI